MILFEILWNLFRKSLGSKLYVWLKKSRFGRASNYYSISTYRDVFEHYKYAGVDFQSKRILEVGCGEQFYTACYFLSSGAESVTLVDPVFGENARIAMSKHVSEYNEKNNQNFDPSKLNISYLKSFEEIPVSANANFDIICSHFVLEHFSSLDSYFSNVSRLLSKDGISYNIVDLSNHTYHVFDSRTCTKWIYRKQMLSHLKFSDSFYNMITDKRIWVNRLLLPAYKSLAEKYDLSVIDIDVQKCAKSKIHKDVIIRNSPSTEEDFCITHFSITLQKR